MISRAFMSKRKAEGTEREDRERERVCPRKEEGKKRLPNAVTVVRTDEGNEGEGRSRDVKSFNSQLSTFYL